MKRPYVVVLLVVALVSVVLPASASTRVAAAQATVTVFPVVGPPTTPVKVSGSGFTPGELVDIFFDGGSPLATVTADGSGSFSGAQITVPGPALPGAHRISATGRSSGATGFAQFLVRVNWTMLGFGSQRRNENPYERLLDTTHVGALVQKWAFASSKAVRASPVIAGGMVFAPCGKALCALDAGTGASVWSQPTGAVSPSTPASSNQIVYAACGVSLCAFNAGSGAPVWSFSTGAAITSSPAVLNGIVYVTSDQLYALDAATGALRWSHAALGTSSPAVANGLVYAFCPGALCALDASTGTLVWSAPYQPALAGPLGATSPALANGVVYVTATNPSALVALDASTGAVKWSFPLTVAFTSSPAVANGFVYAGDRNGNVDAIKSLTGTLAWAAPLGGRVFSTPALADGVLYAGNGAGLTFSALDATTGAPLRSFPTGGAVYGSAAVADGVLYFGSDDHHLYAFALS
jgi:outer membrane protein assembly factor BamB